MNEQLYQNWIEALESGRYTSAFQSLRIENKFCCLGVLCDVYDHDQWTPNHDRYSYLGKTGTLPTQLIEELNLSSKLGDFKIRELSPNLQHKLQQFQFESCSLSKINDRVPDPFPLIAQILRERPKSLFKNEQVYQAWIDALDSGKNISPELRMYTPLLLSLAAARLSNKWMSFNGRNLPSKQIMWASTPWKTLYE